MSMTPLSIRYGKRRLGTATLLSNKRTKMASLTTTTAKASQGRIALVQSKGKRRAALPSTSTQYAFYSSGSGVSGKTKELEERLRKEMNAMPTPAKKRRRRRRRQQHQLLFLPLLIPKLLVILRLVVLPKRIRNNLQLLL
eukprot:15329402-Ditylum_brightwellii.AAC.1